MACGGGDLGDQTLLLGEESVDSVVESIAYNVLGLLDFPESSVYSVQFTFNDIVNGQQQITDHDYVVQLGTDRVQRIRDLNQTLKSATVTLDELQRQLVVKSTAPHLGAPTSWKQDVRRVIHSELGNYRYKVVELGLTRAPTTRRLLELSSLPVSCCLSRDGHKLLIVSDKKEEFDQAVKMTQEKKPSQDLAGEFCTTSGIRVSVFRGNIALMLVDCLVSAVDSQLSNRGGVSLAIATAAGKAVEKECAALRKARGSLNVGDVVETSGGQLAAGTVLHACGPRWQDYANKDQCQNDLIKTITNCLVKATQLGLTSIALPAVSSKTFEVPTEVCAESYSSAIEKFDRDHGRKTTMKDILFVDKEEEKVAAISRVLGQNTDMAEGRRLRLVVVGKSGVGKSCTGNSILGREVFKTYKRRSLKAVTENSSMATTVHNDWNIEIVDTPGLFDSEGKEDDILKEILKSLTLFLPGPHAILLVFRGDDRFTTAEIEVLQKLENLFTSKLFQFLIVVFSHTESEAYLTELLNDLPNEVRELLRKCKGRAAAIDNSPKHAGRAEQANKIVNLVLQLKRDNGNDFYSDELTQRCLQLVQSGEHKDKTLDQIKREIQSGNDSVLGRLMADPQAKAQASKTRRSLLNCHIL